MRARLMLMMVMCLFAAAASFAQSATSTMVGSVVDDSGAVVPGASIVVTQVDTGVLRTAVSNEAGLFRMPALAPGQYSLKVELPGFKPVAMSGINLQSSETRDVGKLVMQVGTQSETVTVSAEITPVQLASAERSSTVTGDQLQNIQLKGRDVFGFTSILPGVLDTNNSRDFTTWTSMRDVSINGSPSGSKNVTIDGVNVIDEGANQNAFVNPNIDAVSEVRVLSNGFQAEFGRNAGGTISIVTKGGTNKLRGSGWYNGRRDKFNATPYLNKIQNLNKPLYRINIEGFSLGGPVVIPKVIGGGNRKLFFFVSQEYTKDAKPVAPVVANLPTAAERNGDFSDTRATNGTVIPIIDPQTGKQFPGNIIPADRIDPAGRAMLNLLPLPNGYVNPQSGQQFTANFQSQNTPLHSRRDDVIRIDANLTEHTNAFVKFIHDREDTISYDAVAPGVGALLNFVPGWVLSGHFSQVLSGTMVNEITSGYGHNNFGNRRPNGEEDQYFRSALGVNPPRLNAFAAAPTDPIIAGLQNDQWPYVPIVTFSGGNRANLPGYFGGTTNGGGRVLPQANRNDLVSVQDDLTKTLGRHNLKTGVYVEYSSKTEPNLGSNYLGNFNFGSTPNNPLDTGYGYSNALLGVFQSYTESTNRANPDLRQWEVEAYVQDNWRMNSRLTLDYGLRLYHVGPFAEITNANAGFFPDLYNAAKAGRLYRPICLTGVSGDQACPAAQQRAIDPVTGQILSVGYQNNIVPGSGDPVIGMKVNGRNGSGDYYDYPTLVPAPRVGFAWDVTGDGKTAVRASAGIFYNRLGKGAYNAFLGSSPIVFDKVIRFATISEIPNLAQSAVVSPVNGVGIAQGKRDLERAYEANFTFQRDIGFHTVVEAAYVGNFVRHGQVNKEQNPIPLYAYGDPANLFNNSPINANFLRTKYPGYGSIVDVATDQNSLDYHGLQLQAQHRLNKGLQFGAAYTLAKAEGMQGYDPYTRDLRGRYYGPTSVDRRHILSLNYSYILPSPSGRGLKQVLGDWQVSGIAKFQTGAPATPGCTSTGSGIANIDPSLTGLGTNAITGVRCQMVSDPYSGFAAGDDPATAVLFNTAAFTMAQPVSATVGNFGNTPIGILRQPSWSNWDITLAKRIALQSRASMRLQFQAYNLFNQKEFTTIGTTYSFNGSGANTNTQTGKYTAQNPPRQLAVTARIEF